MWVFTQPLAGHPLLLLGIHSSKFGLKLKDWTQEVDVQAWDLNYH